MRHRAASRQQGPARSRAGGGERRRQHHPAGLKHISSFSNPRKYSGLHFRLSRGEPRPRSLRDLFVDRISSSGSAATRLRCEPLLSFGAAARLAQSAERAALYLVVVSSSFTAGVSRRISADPSLKVLVQREVVWQRVAGVAVVSGAGRQQLASFPARPSYDMGISWQLYGFKGAQINN